MNSLLCVLLLLTFCVPVQAQKERPIVIAHRGDHTDAPENTLKAFQDAIAHGADYVEVDLRTTRDGKLIVMHDRTVDRTTHGTGAVNELTAAQIEQLYIPEQKQNSITKHRVPLFAEILEACKGKVSIYLDFKDAKASVAWQLIQEFEMENDVVVYINAPEQYNDWRKTAPAVPLMVSLPDSVHTEKSLAAFLTKVDAEILDGDASHYNAKMINLAHQHGRKVWVDVQSPTEGPSTWQHTLELGVDGMQTDHPRELLQWLKR